MALRASSFAFALLLLAGGEARAADLPQSAAERVDALLKEWSETPATIDDLEGQLVAVGTEAAPRLASLLDEARDDDDPLPVAAVARALARTAQGKAVDCLTRLLRSKREADRVAAVVALAEIATPEATALVLGALKSDTHAEAKAAADCVALAVQKDPKSAPDAAFVRSLRDAPNADVVGGLLGCIATPDAHDALLQLLSRTSPDLQSAAMDGLWNFAAAGDCESVRSFLWPGRSSAIRKKAALLLGHLRDVEAIPDLIGLLGDDDTGLATNSLWALREITGQLLEADRELWSQWWDGGGEAAMAQRAAAAAAAASEPAEVDAPAAKAAAPVEPANLRAAAIAVPESEAEPVHALLAFATTLPFVVGCLAAALCAAAIGFVRHRSRQRALA